VRGWVTGARDRTARRDRFDLGELLRGQRLRSERFVNLLDRAHAERRHELRLLAEHPTDRQLTRCDTPTVREVLETGDEPGVRFAIRPVNRGRWARASPGPIGLAESSPRDNTPYSVAPMPSSASTGKIASSGPRLAIEYSIWRSAIGWTFAARLIVSGPTSDSPIDCT
jgi:hypothetical protein